MADAGVRHFLFSNSGRAEPALIHLTNLFLPSVDSRLTYAADSMGEENPELEMIIFQLVTTEN
jgi:hypothetical protein